MDRSPHTSRGNQSGDALSAGFLTCVALSAVCVFAGIWLYPSLKNTASALVADATRTIEASTPSQSDTSVSQDDEKRVSGRQLHGATKFLTFYWLNARVRVDYCAAYGVRIGEFKRVFEQAQATNYRHALDVYARGGGESEERLFQSARLLLTSKIEGDMQAIIKQVRGGPRNACDLVNDKASYIVRHLDFQKDQPELYRAMMGR